MFSIFVRIRELEKSIKHSRLTAIPLLERENPNVKSPVLPKRGEMGGSWGCLRGRGPCRYPHRYRFVFTLRIRKCGGLNHHCSYHQNIGITF